MVFAGLTSSWASASEHWGWLLAAFAVGTLIGWLSGGPGAVAPEED